ncbi:DNA-binding MarR family transcriptional regulator/N-acetylglutamate synthase-like GNAT family acetyltransferase [Polymorphobacter multimanifer]|uniref:DNA-binding MarR family transcriptional regulator/N-acetylglutamate synthase-like GNAT family acetyltransferase n=1 Tax=Polymorphobacter multimanifer TaxID=1070431 RepID=A0A841L673_9SPHN|nr:DNA-binding MarR family transcriptional regulator/N-acetylglutamate synthase-like GNAT family acetyltransferase [Polymorphobacter multimanifer]
MRDVIADMGPAFLGSRLKRLAERMQAGATTAIANAGVPLQPAHMAVLAALRVGPMNVGQLAGVIGISQPGVTRSVSQMAKLGILADLPASDQRTRLVELTSRGRAFAELAVTELWPRIGMAAEELLADTSPSFLLQLAAIERALDHASIAQRAERARPGGLRLREFDDALAAVFHDINVEWISAMFTLEATDQDVLENPRERIIDSGGVILFVEAPGLGIVGTCALQKTGPSSFELTKMGVREVARGLKAGEFLLEAAVARATALQADPLYLLTSRKCAAAIHLYEKLGFAHDTEIMNDYGSRYQRCDVAMKYIAEGAHPEAEASDPAEGA